jgi:hypothetical protein
VAAKFSELEQRLEAIESQLPDFSATSTSQQSPVGEISPSSSSVSVPLKTFSFEVVQVNSQGEITSRENHQAKYFTEQLGNSGVTLEMVYIPGANLSWVRTANQGVRMTPSQNIG